MLSGDGLETLDRDTYNIDSFTADYAVIPSEPTPATVAVAENLASDSLVTQDDDRTTDASPIDRSWHIFGSSNGLQAPFGAFDFHVVRDLAFTPSELLLNRPDHVFAGNNGTWTLLDPGVTNFTLISDVGLQSKLPDAVENFRRIAAVGAIRSDKPAIDVAAPKLDDKPALVLTDGALDPTVIDTVGDRTADVRVEPVAAPVETLRLPVTPTLVTPSAPANTMVAVGDSDAQINVGQVIDELLGADTSVIDQSIPDDAGYATRDEVQLTGTGGGSPVEDVLAAPAGNETVLVAEAAADEGGMIPIRVVVGEVAQEVIAAPDPEQVAVVDSPADISGELARVTVMELIAGEAEPAAPPSEAFHHTLVVAANDATFAFDRVVIEQDGQSPVIVAAMDAVVDQAALAASLVAPANPVYLAAMLNAASDAFAAATMSSPLATTATNSVEVDRATCEDGARSEAFSQWEDDAERGAVTEFGRSSCGLLPIVGVLAAERVVAANRKRKQSGTSQAGRPRPVGAA